MKDLFTRVTFVYEHAVASVKVGTGVKSEGELIVSGTKGYVYVPYVITFVISLTSSFLICLFSAKNP